MKTNSDKEYILESKKYTKKQMLCYVTNTASDELKNIIKNIIKKIIANFKVILNNTFKIIRNKLKKK